MVDYIGLIYYIVTVVIFLIATILALKLYKGKFGIAVPYFVMASFLFLGMVVLGQMYVVYPSFAKSAELNLGIEVLPIVAGLFLTMGLYKIFETRFATEEYEGGKHD